MAKLLAERQNTFWHQYTVVLSAGIAAGVGLDAVPPLRAAIRDIVVYAVQLIPNFRKFVDDGAPRVKIMNTRATR